MELTSEQVAQYDRDGFLVFPDLFSADEVTVLRREVERVSKINSEMVVREGDDGAGSPGQHGFATEEVLCIQIDFEPEQVQQPEAAERAAVQGERRRPVTRQIGH